jgi:hypothetical protein
MSRHSHRRSTRHKPRYTRSKGRDDDGLADRGDAGGLVDRGDDSGVL